MQCGGMRRASRTEGAVFSAEEEGGGRGGGPTRWRSPGAGPGAPGARALLLLSFPSGAQAACSTTMVLGCRAQKDTRMIQKALVGRPSVCPSLGFQPLFIMHTDVFSQLHLLLTRDAWVGFGGGGLGTWVMGHIFTSSERIQDFSTARPVLPTIPGILSLVTPVLPKYLGFRH